MKKHKWKKVTESRYVCEKCCIEKYKIRQIWGGWEYFDMRKICREIGTFTRPDCIVKK